MSDKLTTKFCRKITINKSFYTFIKINDGKLNLPSFYSQSEVNFAQKLLLTCATRGANFTSAVAETSLRSNFTCPQGQT